MYRSLRSLTITGIFTSDVSIRIVSLLSSWAKTDAAAAAKIRNNPVIDLRIPVSVYKLTC